MTKIAVSVQKSFFAMGTANSVTVYAEEHRGAAELCRRRMLELHEKLSAFDPASEVSRINSAAGREAVAVSPDVFGLVDRCISYSEQTHGKFDITAGPAAMLWKRAIRTGALPSPEELESASKLVGFGDIILDEANTLVSLRRAGQSIDLGAVAKGYAADEARKILADHGVRDAIINYGGTVIVMGEAQLVGIRDPFSGSGEAFAAVDIGDRAVVTSGSYEQCATIDSRMYHHIVDPTTGAPSETTFASVTLIGAFAEELDAYSTAIFCMSADEAFAFVRENGVNAIFISNDRNVFVTEGIKDVFRFL